jgi:hypothetical protein
MTKKAGTALEGLERLRPFVWTLEVAGRQAGRVEQLDPEGPLAKQWLACGVLEPVNPEAATGD